MRRFLVAGTPDSPPGPETVIRQVYWRLGDGWTLRLSRSGPPDSPPTDEVALRGPGGTGWEWTLADPAAVAGLFKAGPTARVVKIRRPYGPQWTVEDYHWDNEGLRIAAGTGPPPPWVGREITGDPAYDDETLAFRPLSPR